MMDDLIQERVRRMDKSVETTQHEFNSIRTGRASAALLDHVQVDYYGTPTPRTSSRPSTCRSRGC